MVPIVRVTLNDATHRERAARHLAQVFRGRVQVIGREETQASVQLVSVDSLERCNGPEVVVAVGDPDLPTLVGLLQRHPRLNHVVSPGFLDGGSWSTSLSGALWKLVADRSTPVSRFLGHEFRGRQARVRDSARREQRIETIAQYARRASVPSRALDNIREVAEELITNALYDAPAERSGRAVSRTERVVFPSGEGCTVTYGLSGQCFFVRVRDRFGTLTRKRLCDVLARCASRADVDLDTSRGGAGLGMWRIFNIASLVIVYVSPGNCTEILVGIDVARGRRGHRGRSLHFFFDEGASHAALQVVR
jgi:hypothetical protein